MKTNVLFSNFGEEIIGPKVIELKIYRDDRGFFFESWNQDQLNKLAFSKKTTKTIVDQESFVSRALSGVITKIDDPLGKKRGTLGR